MAAGRRSAGTASGVVRQRGVRRRPVLIIRKNNGLPAIGSAAAQEIVGSIYFGTLAQSFKPSVDFQAGTARLLQSLKRSAGRGSIVGPPIIWGGNHVG